MPPWRAASIGPRVVQSQRGATELGELSEHLQKDLYSLTAAAPALRAQRAARHARLHSYVGGLESSGMDQFGGDFTQSALGVGGGQAPMDTGEDVMQTPQARINFRSVHHGAGSPVRLAGTSARYPLDARAYSAPFIETDPQAAHRSEDPIRYNRVLSPGESRGPVQPN
eukprot:scaffold185039_cov23-Tisochrysis_lutea.AAC.1